MGETGQDKVVAGTRNHLNLQLKHLLSATSALP
jgi:hypothetical protein